MQSREKTIIAFFPGTAFDFEENERGYVPQSALGTTYINIGPRRVHFPDESMVTLGRLLNDDQVRFGYDGCHRRGGGIFAFGIKQPSEHLYKQIKAQLAKDLDKITLILTGHSRGCITASLLAEKISLDMTLKDKVDIVFDFRDPVPGNLKSTVKLDFGNATTITTKLRDLSNYTNIKEAHISVYERGILKFAFNVLIPKFSNSTKLDVEFLPGNHDIQEAFRNYIHYNKKFTYCKRHPDIYQLGIYKSLQIYSEYNASIDYTACLDLFEETHKKCDGRQHREILNLINPLQMKKDLKEDISKEEFESFLKNAQIILYNALLNDYKKYPDTIVHERDLHFDGKYKRISDTDDATHLNDRHILLNPTPNAVSLLGFKGTRVDLATNHAKFWQPKHESLPDSLVEEPEKEQRLDV